jgi:hypothetical protein
MLQHYRAFFQDGFLHATELFYTKESDEFLSKNSVPEYVKLVDRRMAEEDRRVDEYMVRCAFSDIILHSRMSLDPTHVRFKRTCV